MYRVSLQVNGNEKLSGETADKKEAVGLALYLFSKKTFKILCFSEIANFSKSLIYNLEYHLRQSDQFLVFYFDVELETGKVIAIIVEEV